MVFDLKKDFGTDPKKELEGEWVDLDSEGSRLLIARVGNPNFKKAYSKIPRAIQRRLDEEPDGTDTTRPYLVGVIVKTILLGWEGIADEGEEIMYTEETAKKQLLKYPDFLTFVIELGNERKRYVLDELEEDVKNSKGVSSKS